MPITDNKQHQKFLEEFSKLNKEQQLAVGTIEGPVIVNAGPGTGKTQILAARIANILLQTDTAPASILCLTFTDTGAVEMRKRLLKMIGAAAYNVRIHTFHSFCNEVIQDNLSYFGKLNLEPISDLEEIDLFNKMIDSIEKDNPLKRYRGEVYFERLRLKRLFELMKKEAWKPDFLNEKINAYIQELPTKEGFFYKRKFKEFNAGDPRRAIIADEIEKMEILRAAVNLYPRFQQMMKDIGRYDFDDMILWVLDAFEKNKNMLLDYQERFLYFLVDEFQDTSRSQNLLLQYLINYWDVPNVFVVGDADQSIFSFQDANVENIIEFEKHYGNNITKIDLVNNYRSTQPILDMAHQLITHNELRTVQRDEILISSNQSLQIVSDKPLIAEYPNATQETIDIVLQIEKLIQQKISGKEIAVIFRNHVQAEEIVALLEAKNIPVNTRKKINLLHLPFINNIINILYWIDKENYIPYSADDLLFQILHYQFFSLRPIEIAKLSIAVNEKKLSNKAEIFSLRRIIAENTNAKIDLFTQADTSVKDVSNALENLLNASHNVTLQHLIELVIQQTGILSFIMKNSEKPWLMQVLNTFFDFIKEECRRDHELTLHGLLNTFETMRKGDITIPFYKVTTTDDGVNLVTAHSAKGAEFAHVFVISCTQSVWDETSTGNKKNYRLPDNLVSNHNKATTLEESRRLFYVAITRAKTNLQVSYPLKDKKEKEQVKSNFITEILEDPNIQTVSKSLPDELLTDCLALQFAQKAKPEIELIEDAYIDQLLKRYSLSVTHLNNFLECPLKFYYQNLIRVPSAKNENMVFGSAIHFALQRLFEKMKQNNNIFSSKEDMLNDFSWYMQRNREAFTPEQFKRRNEYGEKILPAYYETHINNWNKIVLIEKAFRNIVVQEIPLNGKLDKMEFTGRQVNVVDYKTGKYENGKKKLSLPGEKEPNGGDYWRQAVFYKILIDNDKTNTWEAISTTFEFVEPVNEIYRSEKIVVTREDITTVMHQITDTWNKIQNKEFKTGCGKTDCVWCNFVKTNNLAIALHELAEEETEA